MLDRLREDVFIEQILNLLYYVRKITQNFLMYMSLYSYVIHVIIFSYYIYNSINYIIIFND